MGSSKEKREKRDKRDKKDRIKKKEKKHRHKRSKHEHDPSSASTLPAFLTRGLLRHPVLLTELPQMLAALDQGEVVNVGAIRDAGKRTFLHELFQTHLPVLETQGGTGGWSKQPQIASLSGYTLMDLLSCSAIAQPAKLSPPQLLASRSLPLHLLNLLEAFPQLLPELPALFTSILDGQGVVLDGLENEDIAEALARVFASVGLVNGADGWGLGGGGQVREAVGLVLDMLKAGGAADEKAPSTNSRGGGEAGRTVTGRRGEADRSSSSSSSSSASGSDVGEDDDNDDDYDDKGRAGPVKTAAPPCRKVIGPSLPQTVEDAEKQKQEEEGDMEEEVGPRPAVEISMGPMARYAQSNVPLGLEGHEEEEAEVRRGGGDSSSSSSAGVGGGAGEREEWMLTPGEQRAALEAFGANRTFNQGKLAKKAALVAAQARSSILSRAEPTQEELAAQALREEQRAARGPSLVDLHAAKKAAGKAPSASKGFDYERDVAAHRNKMGSRDLRKMLDESRKLDTRFDRG